MGWIYAVMWCVENLGCYPDWSGFAEELRCQGAELDIVRRSDET